MSLRARLIAGLLAVAAAGLLTLGAIVYAEQRSFLVQRVDQQARSAIEPVSYALDDRELTSPRPADESDRTRHARLEQPVRDRRGRNFNLPPGTYGERRDASGKLLERQVFTYGQWAQPTPRIPARLQIGAVLTVGSTGSSELRYRVLAASTRDHPATTVVAIPLREVDDTLHRLLLVEALVIGGVLIAVAVAAWWIVRLGLRPLRCIGQTAGAIAAGDLSHRVAPATSRTEVGQLGLALNFMLDRLERAFAERQASEDRLRRFLADASHELRTPLASIRGYAELFRLGAARDKGDSEKAMQRIEDESARMGALVDDLLRLARLDDVREPIRREVDLARLAGDATDDACAATPHRSIDLRTSGPAIVRGDPDQLRQVLGNLIGNALAHTPAGTSIDVSLSARDHGVQLEVRDHGPGLPTEDSDEVFERFWRSDPGRGRGRAGAGLGLAIVAGIVSSHGGRVRAENVSGGARFTVWLPARTR